MTRSFKKLPRFLSISLTAAISLAAFWTVPSVKALFIGGGTFHPASCSGAAAGFLTLPDLEKFLGFAGTPWAIQMVNSGEGKCGFNLQFQYGHTGFKAGDEFRSFRFNFKDDEAASKDTLVHFCFRDPSGGIHFVERKLDQFKITRNINPVNWNVAATDSQDFVGENVMNWKLDSITFSLMRRGNITIGNNQLELKSEDTIAAYGMDLTPHDCSILDTCVSFPGS